jgi:putative addiction module component (TIGR02574 family)
MVAKNLIDDLLALPPRDRLDLVHRLWESVREDAIHLPLTAEQKQELDQRYEDFLEDPAEGSSWEEVEAFVRAKLSS